MDHLGRTQNSQAASEEKLRAYACELEQKLDANSGIALARAAATKQTVQIADVQAEPGYFDPLPGFSSSQIGMLAGARTVLAVPMLKQGELVGVIAIYRQEVRPFTEKQIGLVTNFAA